MFENKNFQSWFKENTPKEGLSETMTFSKQFVKDAWDNGYCVGYNKAKKVQVVEHFEAYGQCRDSRRIASLEKEIAALKKDKEDLIFIRNQKAKCMREDKERLTKTKDLLKRCYENYICLEPLRSEIAQFLKEATDITDIREASTLNGDWVVDEH